MKKIIIAVFLFTTYISFSQENTDELANDTRKNELKINTTNFLIFEYLDLSYERLLNEESSIGVSVLTSFGNNEDDFDYYRTFSITPYFRQFFSKKYARGFFVEGFGMLNTRRDDNYDYNSSSTIRKGEKLTSLALGISTGAKFMSRKGFVAEVYIGIGRNIINIDDDFDSIVGRGGVSLGYRF